ncbi:mitochondrial cardiolipin hydrolase isoform X2 [Pseudophryne corroboree]|uniref:mitochondrial cardiolipin hydrolase isoform X2 n=1 Tax=Pseudophryne corroboree TaxID=495146 RepID=UPI0030812E9C
MVPAVHWKLCGLAAIAVTLSLEGLFLFLRRRRPLREVLFFPAPVTCTEQLLSPGMRCPCPLSHTDSALARLMRRLLGARRTLELCVFTFSCPPLARAVLLLHRRGVRVRVITDSDYMAAAGSQIGALRQAGIEVRHSQASGFMHHKFVVLDKELVITGSMNWTMQAIQTNRENLLITDDSVCVRAYSGEFEHLWEEYDPATYEFFPEKD